MITMQQLVLQCSREDGEVITMTAISVAVK